jgi:hypothetical protein
MNLRALSLKDIPRLKKIHEEYFKNEFEFPDFINGYLCAFVVEDEGQIITASGVRTLAESVLLTNKSGQFTIAERREALLKILDASQYICKQYGYDQLHAFIINDENWARHLNDYGFHPTKGKALVRNL